MRALHDEQHCFISIALSITNNNISFQKFVRPTKIHTNLEIFIALKVLEVYCIFNSFTLVKICALVHNWKVFKMNGMCISYFQYQSQIELISIKISLTQSHLTSQAFNIQ